MKNLLNSLIMVSMVALTFDTNCTQEQKSELHMSLPLEEDTISSDGSTDSTDLNKEEAKKTSNKGSIVELIDKLRDYVTKMQKNPNVKQVKSDSIQDSILLSRKWADLLKDAENENNKKEQLIRELLSLTQEMKVVKDRVLSEKIKLLKRNIESLRTITELKTQIENLKRENAQLKKEKSQSTLYEVNLQKDIAKQESDIADKDAKIKRLEKESYERYVKNGLKEEERLNSKS